MNKKLEFLMKIPMIIGIFCFAFVFVARYIRPIIEVKLPFKLDIISYIGMTLFALSFLSALIYLIYCLQKYKRVKK